jgi:trimeric autotransporter adhesin
VSIADTTSNQGGATPTASATSFYLSANLVLDASDVLMGSRAVPPLAAGAAHSRSTSVIVPSSTPAGAYYVFAKTDAGDAISESVETNNTRMTGPIGIGPDLILSSITAPAAVAPGVSFSVNSTTRNQGGGTAAASTTVFYLSTNIVLDAADTSIGSRAISALSPGTNATGSASVTLPASTTIGTYFLLGKADGASAVAEGVETNNTGFPVQIRVGPDLAVSALNVPGAAAGATITIAETTINQGSAATPASTTRFYLSRNTQLDATDVLLGSRTVPALAAGASSAGTTAVVIPAATAPGTYIVIAVADGPGGIVEAVENNNASIAAIWVTP